MNLLANAAILADAKTFAVALLAVFLVGLGKGGLGGALALLGVPILSFVMPPLQAAALLLPILLMMDAVSLWSWRGYFSRSLLSVMLPGAVIGVGIASATAAFVSDTVVKLLVGLVALAYVGSYIGEQLRRRPPTPRPENRIVGTGWGMLAGFTSFIAHAGGPPFQIYALPLRLDPKIFTGSMVMFFAVVNVIKVAPYVALGELGGAELGSAIVLLPAAVLSTLAGAAIVKRIPARIFYPLMNGIVLIIGLKLLWDGVSGL